MSAVMKILAVTANGEYQRFIFNELGLTFMVVCKSNKNKKISNCKEMALQHSWLIL